MRIASLRPSWAIPSVAYANETDSNTERRKNDLWGWVNEDSGAEAFLLALEDSDKWSGHEAFFIASDTTLLEVDSDGLRERFWSDVPVKDGKKFVGNQGFFDCSKAEKLLGWVHKS